MELTHLTVKTKGTCDATSGFATIDGAMHLKRELIVDIEKAALNELSKDKRFNYAELVNPTITNITIVKPYSDNMYNIRCKVNIGTGYNIDIDLHDYKISFNLGVKCD